MPALEEKETRLLARLASTQRPIAIAGAIIALLGATYVVWGVMRFDPIGDPRQNPGFDQPVAQLAFLFARGQFIIENAVPETKAEARLLRGLSRNMNFSTGAMVLLLRVFLGTLALVLGFAMMTVVVERSRLIAMIRNLRE